MKTKASDPGGEARQAELSRAIFRPRSVALVGASGDPAKNTSRVQRYLVRHGYGGRIVPINRSRPEIFGIKSYPELAAVPDHVDHAFIMLPVQDVVGAVRQCGEKGVTVATIYSDGFAESGEAGAARQRELVQAARESGVRILGPNCIGLINVTDSVALTVNATLEVERLPRGSTAVVSQSGSMIGTILSRGAARGLGYSKLVSVGNEADLGVGEISEMLVEDADTDALLLFIETIRDHAALRRAALRAHELKKPVIAYKLGRSTIASDLARSHTGALAGDDKVIDAFLKDCGILRVANLEAFLELPRLVRRTEPPKRKRLAVVTTTGGGAAMVADNLESADVEVVPPPPSLVEALRGRGIRVTDAPITDLTLAGTFREVYLAVLSALMDSDHCDAVLAVVGSSAQFYPERAVSPIIECAKSRTKPLLTFLAPQADRSIDLLSAAGVAAFREPESCAEAIRALFAWRDPNPNPKGALPTPALEALRALRGDGVDELGSYRVIGALGIRTPETWVYGGASVPDRIQYPVVAKVLSPDIPHKTEVGGVRLNLRDEGALRQAVSEIRENVPRTAPAARVDGVIVQPMERGLAEAILGFRRDPQVGPIVMVGVGGTLAEIYRDVAIRPAPVSLDGAREMVAAVRGLAPIRGYRGQPRGDVEALAAAIVALSQLAADGAERVQELEINPLLVKEDGQGVVALDGLLSAAAD